MLKKVIATSLLLGFGLINAQKKGVEAAFTNLKEFQNVRDLALTADGNEMYFTLQSFNDQVAKIAFCKKENGKWSQPELVSFSSSFRDIEPFLTEDGLRLYFVSNRPLHSEETKSKDYDIWYVQRKSIKEKWSNPINLGKPVNTDKDEFYPSVANNGNLYFTSENDSSLGKDDIFMSKFENNVYTTPVNLGTAINSEGYEFNAYVDRNENFLIYTAYNRKDGLGSGDLYISYKENDTWQPAKNLSQHINSPQMDYCPFYDAKNETLYFTSKRNLVNDKKFENLEEFKTEILKYENGFSRIYKVKLKL